MLNRVANSSRGRSSFVSHWRDRHVNWKRLRALGAALKDAICETLGCSCAVGCGDSRAGQALGAGRYRTRSGSDRTLCRSRQFQGGVPGENGLGEISKLLP